MQRRDKRGDAHEARSISTRGGGPSVAGEPCPAETAAPAERLKLKGAVRAPAQAEQPASGVGEGPVVSTPPLERASDDMERCERLIYLRALAVARGGACLSSTYSKGMRWRCANGHEWEASPYTIARGHWCQNCALTRIAATNMARGFARVQEMARRRGGVCLSSGYTDPSDVLRWRCAEGHEWECTANTIRARSWCPECLLEPKVRLSMRDMQAVATERGGECLSPAYRGPMIPLRWRCAKGHEWEAPPQFVRHQHTWCPQCWNGPRKGIAAAREDARVQGGVLLSPCFQGVDLPHRYRCRLGHEFEMRPSHVASGSWCSRCRQAAAHDRERLQEVITRRGGTLISEECGQSRDRVRVRCREGHEWLTLQSNLMSGAWCRSCATEARTGRPLPRLSIIDMREAAAKLGGECLSDCYVNSYTKLRWRCQVGHEWDARPNQIRMGSWCPLCARSIRGALEAMRALASERGGECLSERYQNHKEHLQFRCSRGHFFTATGTVIKAGIWCPTCDQNHAVAATATRPRRGRGGAGNVPGSVE
jgi:hypothetical protein